MSNRRIKYILSFFKRNWTLQDYPVIVKPVSEFPWLHSKDLDDEKASWVAMIEGMHFFSTGQTKAEALAKLEGSFQNYKENKAKMPRPGVQTPIEQYSTEKLDANKDLVEDFMQSIIGLSPGAYFISDRSNLHDFLLMEEEMDIRIYQRKIALVYKADVTDIEDGNLAQILQRIREKKDERK